MELSTFEDLLDRHGGTLAAWPEEARREAAALLAASPDARAALAAMRAVEAVLCLPVDGDLPSVDTLAATAMRRRQEGRALRLARRAGWATAAALMLALGLSLGHLRATEHEDSPDHTLALALDISGTTDVD